MLRGKETARHTPINMDAQLVAVGDPAYCSPPSSLITQSSYSFQPGGAEIELEISEPA